MVKKEKKNIKKVKKVAKKGYGFPFRITMSFTDKVKGGNSQSVVANFNSGDDLIISIKNMSKELVEKIVK